jgi:hypothetical protein
LTVTLVLFELPPGTPWLVPASIPQTSQRGATRARSNYSLAQIELPPEQIRQLCGENHMKAGVGAAEVWKKFPDYRNEFTVRIERETFLGAMKFDIPIKNTILGDTRLDKKARLTERPRYDYPSRLNSSSMLEEFEVDEKELDKFPQLLANEETDEATVFDQYIYFCDNFSIVGANGAEIAPGVRFLSPRMLLRNTDLLKIVAEKTSLPPKAPKEFAANLPRPNLPTRFSGALVVRPSTPDNADYADALVNRILAAAALTGARFGKVPSMIRFNKSGWSGRQKDQYADRPYCDRLAPETYSISSNAKIFTQIVKLLKSTNLQDFLSAKEDFRLLALDTIEDSRRSTVLVLRFAQMWIAIERLLQFKTETTAQLALSLSAFVDLDKRAPKFKELKKWYGLRSKIVHGYDFSKKDPVPLDEIAQLFRSVFSAALGFSKADQLREALISHVLTGQKALYGKATGSA